MFKHGKIRDECGDGDLQWQEKRLQWVAWPLCPSTTDEFMSQPGQTEAVTWFSLGQPIGMELGPILKYTRIMSSTIVSVKESCWCLVDLHVFSGCNRGVGWSGPQQYTH